LIERPDLLPEEAPEEHEVSRLTTDETLPACHVYMEAQIFHPDPTRFVLHESAHPHGSDPDDPNHRYVLCDLEDEGRLSPLTHECGVTAPCVSPDGEYLYYFVDNTPTGDGSLILKRVRIDGSDRETVHRLEDTVPGTSYPFSNPYPLSTISSDGRPIALPGFLGGNSADAPRGLLVYDPADPTPRLGTRRQRVLPGSPVLARAIPYCHNEYVDR